MHARSISPVDIKGKLEHFQISFICYFVTFLFVVCLLGSFVSLQNIRSYSNAHFSPTIFLFFFFYAFDHVADDDKDDTECAEEGAKRLSRDSESNGNLLKI